MAFNGVGVFARLYNWAIDAAAPINISSSRMDAEMDGFATGLTNAICKDGQSVCSAIITFAFGIDLGANGKIKFPASQSPSADLTTLDDYKEIAFIPVPTFVGGSVGMTTSIAYGKATKIGDRVFFDMQVLLSAKGSSTGAFSIGLGTLPLSRNVANARWSFAVYPDALTGVSGGITALMANNDANISFYYTGTGTAVALSDTTVTNTSRFVVTGSYGV